MSFFKWSTTAATNATADGTINLAEGMAPSAVNDSARAMMAAAAKYRIDQAGIATGGTSTAYTVTTNQVYSSLAVLDANVICIVPHTTSGAAPTLAVDGLAAKAINISTTVAVPTGALISGTSYLVRYVNASTEFILLGAVVSTASLTAGIITPVKLATASVPYGAIMLNGTLVESRAGNASTFAVKTLAGTDPSATDVVYFMFRNVTIGTGDFTVRTVSAALSVTVSSGSTAGFTSALPGRLWLLAIDNAGTVELAFINCAAGINIYPLKGWGIISTTAEGGAGAADSAAVAYSTTARSSVPYVTLGYYTWETGGTLTAGTWNAAPTRIQIARHGVPLPGERVQIVENYTGAVATGSTATPNDDSIPTITEGTQFLTQAITPTSSNNLLRITSQIQIAASSGPQVQIMALHQDATSAALAVSSFSPPAANHSVAGVLRWTMLANTLSATTLRIRCGNNSGTTLTFNGDTAARSMGGAYASYLSIEEVMS